jgi:hypothetical protein
MEYNGILYKHTHPRLIDKELFNLYQDALTGKNLHYSLRKPFDLMVNLSEQTTWLPSFNIFRNKQDDILSTMNRPMMEGVRLCLAA